MWRFGVPVLIILTLLPLGVCAVCAAILPETVPLHMGIDGTIDRWGPKWEFLAIMGGTTMFVGVLCTLCYAFAPQLKRMNLLSAPKNNDVGIARWILIGSMVFCDATIIGIVIWFTSIALSTV